MLLHVATLQKEEKKDDPMLAQSLAAMKLCASSPSLRSLPARQQPTPHHRRVSAAAPARLMVRAKRERD
jgi:hypothetical protein